MSHQINVGSVRHDLAAYQQAAMETKVNTTQEQFLSMFGIWGELREIDHAWGLGQIPELIEELGDLLWYVALACHISGLQLHDYAPAQRPLSTDAPVLRDVGMRDLWVPASRLAEALKKYSWQYQDRPDVGVHVRPLLIAIQRIALQVCQVDMVTIAQRNRAKLQRRYPNGLRPVEPGPAPMVQLINRETGKACRAADGTTLYQVITGPHAGAVGSRAALTAQCGAVQRVSLLWAICASTGVVLHLRDGTWHPLDGADTHPVEQLQWAVARVQDYCQQAVDMLAILSYGDDPRVATLRPQIQALHHQIHELVPPLVKACQEDQS